MRSSPFSARALVAVVLLGCPSPTASYPPNTVVLQTPRGVEMYPVGADGWYEIDDPDAVVLYAPPLPATEPHLDTQVEVLQDDLVDVEFLLDDGAPLVVDANEVAVVQAPAPVEPAPATSKVEHDAHDLSTEVREKVKQIDEVNQESLEVINALRKKKKMPLLPPDPPPEPEPAPNPPAKE